MLLSILISFIGYSYAQLEIQACCANRTVCHSFQRAEDLFGMSCCGQQPFNTYQSLCCSNVVQDRRRNGAYAELCCGTQVLQYDQTCCNGVVHNVLNGDCCGQAVYSKQDKNILCCNNALVRTSSSTDVCCGSKVFDGGRTQICCGDLVSDKTQADSCCQRNDGSFIAYRSSDQFCCNGPEPKNSAISCCYLRVNGQIQPTRFNKNQQCCRYPYDQIYPLGINNTCVVDG